ncbi:Elongation factor G [Devosia sp. LC5]|uniref:elongation factor G n=1 Tax=Devosia sp. LC5 TaxID=1502724 RepID=UPI0004E37F20|nr:TetM/TetW/TetO/TetS family tetracycline resistance ribosomal protection protein [Devosia sp. LC5]KFC61347.1 Elongation factor G [Devosia sp. LC5]
MRTLNLGILAHVDAGKTSLTERLLFNAGVIGTLGSVDSGNTQTDSLALERQRGITIRAAVVSFMLGETSVNLIDTPGHPDFIAEVERVLELLDAAVVVVSAVEGVQAQTRVLVRALRRLGVPMVFFINKVDRVGAQYERVIAEIAQQLPVRPIAMSGVFEAGSKAAQVQGCDLWHANSGLCETLAENDDALLSDYVMAPHLVTAAQLKHVLAGQVANGLVQPAFAGSATTGIGVPALSEAIESLLPARLPDADGAVAGKIFKIERGWGGEKLAYLALHAGIVHTRDLINLPDSAERVTGIELFEHGQVRTVPSLQAGQIGRISGLKTARIGDAIGKGIPGGGRAYFAPPTLETRVLPRRPADSAALWLALGQLAEQDPLINLRRNEDANEVFVSLYGEVQKEVIQASLLADFGLEASFAESTVICVERPTGTAEGLEIMFKEPNPYIATVGLRIEPRPAGAGNSFALEVDPGHMPASFYRAVEEGVSETLRQGRFGWQVVDCHVAVIAARHREPASVAADFRQLTPLVLAAALSAAQNQVCEPINRFHLEAPVGALSALLTLLARAGAAVAETVIAEGIVRATGTIAAAQLQSVQQQLPGLTSGAGVLEASFDHYAPVHGTPPARPRSGADPFNRTEYLLRVRRNLALTPPA